MKPLLIVLVFTLFSCTSSPSLESRVKGYMSDTVAKQLNDPKSYEFISMQVDTTKGLDLYQETRRLSEDTVLFDADKRAKMKGELQGMDQHYKDSIIFYFIKVNYRGNNKLGIPVADQVRLKYTPQDDKIQVLQ